MVKVLLALALIASLMFFLTQIVTIYYFNDQGNVIREVGGGREKRKLILSRKFVRKKRNLIENIRLFLKVCTAQHVQPVLIERKILQEFLQEEIQHRKNGVHNHNKCSLFCNKRLATFLVEGGNVTNIASFVAELSKNFSVTKDTDYDQRQVSIEILKTREKLLYHLYLKRGNAYIHLTFTYGRLGKQWTHRCNPHFLQSSIVLKQLLDFCKYGKLLEPLTTSTAVIDGQKIKTPKYLGKFLKDVSKWDYLECNYNNARRFFSSYGLDSSEESETFRFKATHLLSLAINVLQELKIRFWLSSGTCLGWFRQCDFIPHSKDVDIGVWIKDYKIDLIQAFKDKGMTLKHIFGKVEDSFELSFKRGDMKLDIFFFYEDENSMWNGGTQAKTGKKFKYTFHKFNLCWTTLNKLLVRVPCDTETYIKANYGNNWNVLVKTWDWKASPPNVKENGVWPEEEHANVIQVFE